MTDREHENRAYENRPAPDDGLRGKKPMRIFSPQEEFPSSLELPEGARSVKLKDSYGYRVDYHPNVVYANRDGMDLHLQIMIPGGEEPVPQKPWPLLVFVQGSAWRKQNLYDHLPEQVRMCQRGYALAVVEYRPSETAPFPAQAQDAKTAVRFMRSHAADYHIDPDRIAIWGDSSGGHTALIVGLTGDGAPDADGDTGVSARVRCIVDWYGPSDIEAMNYYPSIFDHAGPDSSEGLLIGGKNVLENREEAWKTSPMYWLDRDRETPPVLIMHGTKDRYVPYNQSCRLFETLRGMGKEAEFIRLEEADHGVGGFQCDEALDLVEEFLKKHLRTAAE